VNYLNPRNFGTVTTDTGAESTMATGGGQPMMNNRGSPAAWAFYRDGGAPAQQFK
jgi:hypothetical protein